VNRRFNQLLLGACFGLLFSAGAGLALAGNDQQARTLRNEAIQQDYLAMKFDDAVDKLQKALDLCGTNACSPSLIARLHRDLGVVYIAGLEENEEGKAEFISALNIDATITLDKDLTSDRVDAVFAEVKAAMAESKAKEKKEADDRLKAETGGDIQHKPPTEGAVQTPLPLFAKLKPGFKATKLKVRFKNDTGDWLGVDMKKIGEAYGVELPCKGVGASPRMLEYFVEASVGGDVVALNGSRTAPHKVAIKRKLDGPPPALPGEPPPTQCVEECPPGACTAAQGEECHEDQDCAKGLACTNRVCTPAKPDATKAMGKRIWVTAAFQVDFMVLGPQNDVCLGGNAYKCYWANGTYYYPMPDTGEGAGDKIGSTGFGASTMRALVGADYLLTPRISIGGRLGYAFKAAPEGFLPVHAEARAAYWFIPRSPTAALLPYAVFAAGLGQVDGHIAVSVRQTDPQPNAPGAEPAVIQAGSYNLTAWRKGGPVFASLGVGAMYQIAGTMGVNAEVKVGMMFPNFATIGTFQIGASYGF
jgi:hypothetical protein